MVPGGSHCAVGFPGRSLLLIGWFGLLSGGLGLLLFLHLALVPFVFVLVFLLLLVFLLFLLLWLADGSLGQDGQLLVHRLQLVEYTDNQYLQLLINTWSAFSC